jgi:hypothetical protein
VRGELERKGLQYNNKESAPMNNYKEDNSVELVCIVLFLVSLLVVCGVAWAVH